MTAGNATPTGRAYHIIREAELDHARQNGHRLRAYCPVHGSDRQRSLDIECEGEAAGWGLCRACSARVFVPELARPDVAARILAGQRSGPRQTRPITAADMLRPPRPRPTPPAVTIGPELAQLRALDGRMRERLADDRARAYLDARAIPFEMAQAYGVGYIRADLPTEWREDKDGKRHEYITGTPLLAAWRDRVMLPLGAPASAGLDGVGYIGRSLWRWTPELDENAHKALFDSTPGAPKRWLKTQAPAGWFNYAALAGAETAIIVEGGFDALALLAAGYVNTVALGGTAAASRVDFAWIPAHVRGVVLALDEDKPEARAAAADLARELRRAGVRVERCAPPADGLGKDPAERWRMAQWDGVKYIADACERLDSALDGGALDAELARILGQRAPAAPIVTPAATPPAVAPAVAPEAPPRPPALTMAERFERALADPVIAFFLAQGFELADVRSVAA